MNGLRWRLARLFAPVPIMAHPLPDGDGLVVLVRSGDGEIQLHPDRFRLKSTHALRRLDYGSHVSLDELARPSLPFVRFVGTLPR